MLWNSKNKEQQHAAVWRNRGSRRNDVVAEPYRVRFYPLVAQRVGAAERLNFHHSVYWSCAPYIQYQALAPSCHPKTVQITDLSLSLHTSATEFVENSPNTDLTVADVKGFRLLTVGQMSKGNNSNVDAELRLHILRPRLQCLAKQLTPGNNFVANTLHYLSEFDASLSYYYSTVQKLRVQVHLGVQLNTKHALQRR